MAGVDLTRYDFDRDLTFCVLLMHRDGTIYHTYGGRSWKDAQSHLSMPSLLSVLVRTLPEHEKYRADPAGALVGTEWTVERLAPLARRIDAGDRPDCIHCHSVQDWEVASATERGTWVPEDAGVYPDPIQVGLAFDRDDQARIVRVVRNSAAEKAGLVVGDRIEEIAGRPIATFGDVQRALHRHRGEFLSMKVGPETRVTLRLGDHWRDPDPLLFSWRSMKWNLEPAPGFGGPQIDRSQIAELGLPPETFAFRVQYLVTWGHRAYTGRNARKAGIRKGDVILAVDGKRDFESVEHFHSWFRLTKHVGQTIPVELMRAAETRVIELPVVGAQRD
jgi:hypothetical protein